MHMIKVIITTSGLQMNGAMKLYLKLDAQYDPCNSIHILWHQIAFNMDG